MSHAAGRTEDPASDSVVSDAERRALLLALDRATPEAISLARWMATHPELSLEERATSECYRRHLESRGFAIQTGVAGMETAFLASWGEEDAPIRVGLLAEMDALPEIGHACGHNLSGPASLLAATALSETLEPGELRLVVYGCPAEETGVGKRRLVEAGCFEAVDVAMMAHASDMRRAHRLFLGNQKFELVYRGRAAHAAAYPQQGVNALDAVVSFYTSVGLLRQQLASRVRVHVIISEGGKAPNIIPERAAARVWVRALDPAELAEATEKVMACAEGAARASGAELEVVPTRGCSPPMKPNLPLAGCYRRQLDWLGLPETDHAPDQNIGSSDITHVSRVVPTIHPNFSIAEPGQRLELHTREFAAATEKPAGEAGLLEGARALALTALELARDSELREAVAGAHSEPSDTGGRGAR